MAHPEQSGQLSLKDLFPEAISAQSIKISDGNEELVDPTPTRRCIAFVCSDEKVLSELHLNNGQTSAGQYADSAVDRLKQFYGNKFKVILIGGDALISQNYVDAVLDRLKNDKQIIFDQEHSDTGGVWVRHIIATKDGVKISRTERSWGKPENLFINFPNTNET